MPATRRTFLRRRIAVFGTIGALLASGFYLPLTLLAPLAPASSTVQQIEVAPQTAASLGWPGYGASGIGAVGYDGVLATSGATTPLPIASLTKIVTALVVLEERPLAPNETGPDITFTAKDVAIRDGFRARNGNVAPVSVGLVLSQRDVLQVMLLESANNYAESLAVWAYGSEHAFLDAAAIWLAEKGLGDTQLHDATGMTPLNTSTPADLVEIGRLALADPLLAEIVSTKLDTVPGVGDIENSNKLLGIDGIRGIKTGTLNEAGACLLFAADFLIGSTTVTVIGVVLGAVNHPTLNAQVQSLLGDVRAGFHDVQLTTAGEQFATYSTPWGASATAVAAEDLSVLVWGDTPIDASVVTTPVGIAAGGTSVGTATFVIGDATVTVPLELSGAIEDPGLWWRLTNPAHLF